MKKFNIVGLALSSLVLASIATSGVANATVTDAKNGSTETDVTITDQTDPSKANLVLLSVPDKYSFTSTVQNHSYDLKAVAGTGILNGAVSGQSYKQNDLVVSNDSSMAKWTLTASVVGAKISGTPKTTNTATDFPVSSFMINKNELLATGANPIVFQNGDADSLPAGMTTGQLTKAVGSVEIQFADAQNVLSNGDALKGTINYVLANTSAAK